MHRPSWSRSRKDDRRRSQRISDADRPSAHARGYDETWRRFRLMRLADDPVCQAIDAGNKRCSVLSQEVHHVIRIETRRDLRLDPDNTVCLCKPHHSAITAIEDVAGQQAAITFAPNGGGGRGA